MQLLLLKDVSRLGYVGDVVNVKTGYARNYLLPQRLATEPTDENIAAIQEAKVAAAAERARKAREWQTLAQSLADVSVTIEAAANEEGTLYGSVGPREISAALKAAGHPIEPSQVALDQPIRTVDNRPVTIRFNDDISAQVKVWVVREGAINEPSDEPSADDERDDSDEDNG